jgi:hypothetical protein
MGTRRQWRWEEDKCSGEGKAGRGAEDGEWARWLVEAVCGCGSGSGDGVGTDRAIRMATVSIVKAFSYFYVTCGGE